LAESIQIVLDTRFTDSENGCQARHEQEEQNVVEVLSLARSAQVFINVPMRNNGQPKLSSLSTSADLLSNDTIVFIVGVHLRLRNSYQTDVFFLVTNSQFAFGSMIFRKVPHFQLLFCVPLDEVVYTEGCCLYSSVSSRENFLDGCLVSFSFLIHTTKTTESTNYDSQDGRIYWRVSAHAHLHALSTACPGNICVNGHALPCVWPGALQLCGKRRPS